MGGLGHVAGDPHRLPPVATGERGLEADGPAVVAGDDDHFGGVGAVGQRPGDDRGPAHRQGIGGGHGHGPVELVDGDDVVDDRPGCEREPVARRGRWRSGEDPARSPPATVSRVERADKPKSL